MTTPDTQPGDQTSHQIDLASYLEPWEAAVILSKDLALHAAIRYWEMLIKSGKTSPPAPKVIVDTAKALHVYYDDYEAQDKAS